MRKYGLLGKNISYSFSKKYFNNFFKKNNILGCEYHNLDIDNLKNIRDLIFEENFQGLNVTIPYKESILNYVDDISNELKKIGASNTLLIKNKKIIAYNTDIFGFEKLIANFINKVNFTLIIGSGGASKAIEYLLYKNNKKFDVVSRNKKSNKIISYQDLKKKDFEKYELVINTTPLGTFPDINKCPNIPYNKIKKGSFFVDLTYNPVETLFMKNAKSYGANIFNGEKMLIEQAKKSWEIWDFNR